MIVKKIIKIIFNLALHILAIAALAWFFWPFFDISIRAFQLIGYDSSQFVYFVNLCRQSHPLPPAGWDHFWYEGTPKVLDNVFLPHYLIQPLVGKFGLALATKIFPLFWLGFFFLASYFLFYRLSKNQLISFALTLGLISSQSVYLPIYENGVVVSGIAQSIFPAVLLFLVLYTQTKSFRYLILAALSLAFQFYNHGGLALVFGFAPAVLFLVFSKIENEKLFSLFRLKRLLSFTLITLGVGALAILPQIHDAMQGGLYSKAVGGQASTKPEVFQFLIKNTHPALFIGLGLAILVGIIFWRKQKFGLLLPFIMILFYFLLFLTAIMLGKNPVGDFLFPGRIIWFFALTIGSISALLFSPLTEPLFDKFKPWKVLLPFIWIFVGGTILFVLMTNPLQIDKYKPFARAFIPNKIEGDRELGASYKDVLKGVLGEIDQKDINYRIWIHSGEKIIWNIVSDIPQVEGYFNYRTKYSGEWTAWFNATLVEEVVKSQTIPQDMADKQALFLIDWFGAKYLYAYPGEEFNLAPRFWQENDYVLRKSADEPPAVFTIKPEFTSGIIGGVKVPVIGFVGSEDGYNVFLRDLGMLNLNTHYLIPLRLGTSINNVSKDDLEKLDLLVLYGLKSRGGDWGKILDFVKKGGSLFIETGGNSAFSQEVENLPEVFPMDKLNFGSLGKEWQVEKKEEMAKVDFAKLEPLIYQGEPWKLSYIENPGVLRAGSNILLTQAGKPVVVERDLASGKVVWSGLNSWYRPWELKKNGMTEVEIINIILRRLFETPYTKPVEVEINREKPEKVEVLGRDFSGVVFKEKNLPGWKAWVVSENKKKNLKIYGAGIDVMYVKMPKEFLGKTNKVVFEYKGPLDYWIFFGISIFSLIIIIFEFISGGFLSKKLGAWNKLGKNVKGWWEREDEEEV